MSNIQRLALYGFALVGISAFTGCGIGKMIKNAGNISYTVSPNPMELHGDSVKVSVNGVFPPKYFHKKASVVVTPVVKYRGGEKVLRDLNLSGEKLDGGDQRITYSEGGKFSIADRFLYASGMENAELVLRAKINFKRKTTDLPEVKIADGTIVTPLLLQKDYKVISAEDIFDKNPTVTQKQNLYFLVDSWEVRNVELQSDETVNMNRFIDKAAKDGSEFTKLDVYGFASPEGELDRNAKLSANRADEGEKLIMTRFKKNKLKGYADKEGFANVVATDSEDWDGLRKMLSGSSINGKDAALNIINTVNDPQTREQQFRELASYDPIYSEYFPKLRRAEINLSAKLKVRTDEQIKTLAISAPDSLGMEELLYGASLQAGANDKFKVFEAFARRYPEDFRGFNNMGAIYFEQGKYGEAQAEFEKAGRIASKESMIQNNLGAVAAVRGDRKAASGFFTNAGGSKEVTYNQANLSVAAGKYAAANTSYGDVCSYNAALAKLLAGNASGALQTLDCSSDKESAEGYYLKAIIAARGGNKSSIADNLSKAISKDAKLKERAKNDKEFLKYSSELGTVLN
jgi:Flp pilus assembly protein TadD